MGEITPSQRTWKKESSIIKFFPRNTRKARMSYFFLGIEKMLRRISFWNVIFRRGGKRKREIVSWEKKNGYLCRVKKQENASAGSKMALKGV